jgi:hypothetical protein
VGRAVYDISKDTELKGIIGEAFVDALVRRKEMIKLDNAMCINLNYGHTLYSALEALSTLEKYNDRCQWGLASIFEDLWRRKNAYEVFNEIWGELRVFINEMGIVIRDPYTFCSDSAFILLEAKGKCKLCGEYYEPPDFGVIYLVRLAESKSKALARSTCPTIHVCAKCFKRLLDKGVIKIWRGREAAVTDEYLKNFALLWVYCELYRYLEYFDFIVKVGNIDFLKDLAKFRPMSPFDFICIDNNGEKYVIDVKTTTSQKQTTSSKISKEWERSGQHIQLALNQGFRVLLPIVRVEKDWKIILELVEIT